ncbi:4Fe-4S binding protein [Fibrobacterota bacterium]
MDETDKQKTLGINRDKCISCAGCVGLCPQLALDMYQTELQIFQKECNFCRICVRFCPLGALRIEKEKV